MSVFKLKFYLLTAKILKFILIKKEKNKRTLKQ